MPDEVQTNPSAGFATDTPVDDLLRRNKKRAGEDERTYYDISLLKPPVWTPEVGVYFFFGGLSAGAYVLARLAERFGGEEYKDVTRAGSLISLAAALPCAPLLIVDLGDPKRFHHMLRVFKPHSPMNLGTWVLTSYTAFSALAALREAIRIKRNDAPADDKNTALDGTVQGALDAVGVPLAFLLAGYTGVLLSTTSTPVWCKNPWIGALFSASAMHAGSTAIRLALEAEAGAGGAPGEETPSRELLAKMDLAGTALEAATLVGYLGAAGDLAKPLTEGEQAPNFWLGAVGCGLILPSLIEHLPVSKKNKWGARVLAAIIGLIGGFAVRWAFLEAGKPSANDPAAARSVSRAPHESAAKFPYGANRDGNRQDGSRKNGKG